MVDFKKLLDRRDEQKERIARDLDKIHNAVTNGASAHSKTDPLKPYQPMSDKNTTDDATGSNHDYALTSAVRPDEIADELGQGEYVTKPDLASAGPFILTSVSKRTNLTFRNKPSSDQYTFECQLTTGEHAGAKVLCSFDVNIVRDKYAAAVRKHGAVGPVVLVQEGNAYIFRSPDAVVAVVDATPVAKNAGSQDKLPFDA